MFNWWYSADECKRIRAEMSKRGVFIKQWDNDRITVKDDALRIKIHKRNKAYHIACIDTVMYKLRYVDQCKLEALMIDNWPTIREMLLADTPRFTNDVFEGIMVPHLNAILELVAPENVQNCSSALEFVSAVRWLLRAKEMPKLREHVLKDDAEPAPVAMELDDEQNESLMENNVEAAQEPPSEMMIENDATPTTQALSNHHLVSRIAEMSHKPDGWITGGVDDFKVTFFKQCLDINSVGRRVVFMVDSDTVYCNCYIDFRKLTHPVPGVTHIIESVDQARDALVATADLKLCPGYRQSLNAGEDYGFQLMVRKALRIGGDLQLINRPLAYPAVGGIYGRTKKTESAVEDSEELDFGLEAAPPVEKNEKLEAYFNQIRNEVGGRDLSMLLERENSGAFVFRSVDCQMVGTSLGNRCACCESKCAAFGKQKRKQVSFRIDDATPRKKRPYGADFDSPRELSKRLKAVSNENNQLHAKIRHLKKQAEELRLEHGFTVAHEEDHDKLALLFQLTDAEAKKVFPDDSPMRAIWDDTVENIKRIASNKDRRGSKYSELTIRTALSLSKRLSNTQYNIIREYFFLPSKRALHAHDRFAAESTQGVLTGNIREFKKKADGKNYDKGWQRTGCLSFDSMTLRGGLWFDVHTGRILGVAESNRDEEVVLSELNALAKKAQSDLSKKDAVVNTPEPAKNYLVFYYNCLGVSDFAFPVAHYVTNSITASFLVSAFKSVVIALENKGFHVIAVAFDGAGENRTFAKMLATIPASDFIQSSQVPFDCAFYVAVEHPIYGKLFPIFLIPDPPHIWKKVVNALESSNPTRKKKTRSLAKLNSAGQITSMSLSMCETAWENYESPNGESLIGGQYCLRRCTRLSKENFHRTHFSKMSVKNAVRVTSQTMVDILTSESQRDQNCAAALEPLTEFCRLMDRFVDACNGRQPHGNITSLESNALATIKETVSWFENWHAEINNHQAFSKFTKDAKKIAFLPEQCYFDIQLYCKSLVCMSHYVFSDRFPFAQSKRIIVQRRLGQDICEHHFGQLRQRAGGSISSIDCRAAFRGTGASAVVRHVRDRNSNSGQAAIEGIDEDSPARYTL